MDFRQRLEQSRLQVVSGATPSESGEQTAFPYFAMEWNKTPICLELRLTNGCRKAVPYSYFTEICFDADVGIEISTSQKRIRITGRNLATLFEHLVAYRVRYVQTHIGNDAQEDGVFVAKILVDEI